MGHEHAHLMKLYAEDAEKYDEPWGLWEVMSNHTGKWLSLKGHPLWIAGRTYRRKPQRFQATIDIPAPCRTPLKHGDDYYVANLYRLEVEQLTGFDDDVDRRMLANGFVYTNKEDAQAAVDAIAKLFKGEPQ